MAVSDLRTVLAGLAGGLVWIAAMFALFAPALLTLADSAPQSKTILNVMGTMDSFPRGADAV
jgi:hypothetical protein